MQFNQSTDCTALSSERSPRTANKMQNNILPNRSCKWIKGLCLFGSSIIYKTFKAQKSRPLTNKMILFLPWRILSSRQEDRPAVAVVGTAFNADCGKSSFFFLFCETYFAVAFVIVWVGSLLPFQPCDYRDLAKANSVMLKTCSEAWTIHTFKERSVYSPAVNVFMCLAM